MAYYRLYFFDGTDRIEHFREFELSDDLLAIQQSAEWRCAAPMELWTGTRMVRRWDRVPNSDCAWPAVLSPARHAQTHMV